MDNQGKIIAITGNIGSGKSTVMSMLEKRGYKTLSADKFTQEAYVLAKGELCAAFGDEVFQNGEISRKNLSKVAFSSSENLKKLNSIIHPIIFNLIFAQCKNQNASFVEVPLLFESGMQDYFSRVWIIAATAQNKITRAAKRDNLEKEEIEKRLAFQINHEEKTEKVHIIIENNGNVEELEIKVQKALRDSLI